MRRITATQFKAKCLGLLDEVERTGGEIVVTKHGTPVARVVPMGAPPDLRGSVTYLVSDADLIAPTGDAWDADR
jgi:prevent-host-death family protein